MKLNGYQHDKIEGDILISVCCVCNRLTGIKSADGAEGGISHSYCVKCLNEMRAER